MAKRTRYTGRPAGRRPAAKPSGHIAGKVVAPTPVPTASPDFASTGGGLTDDELARAAALESEIAAREKAAIAANARRSRARGPEGGYVADVNAPLSVRAAHEYAYVARDVRRILLTGGLMVAILAVLYVLVHVLGVISI